MFNVNDFFNAQNRFYFFCLALPNNITSVDTTFFLLDCVVKEIKANYVYLTILCKCPNYELEQRQMMLSKKIVRLNDLTLNFIQHINYLDNVWLS